LIFGGLKGLCASLAVYLAKCGAKHLAVISRSGYTEKKSQGVVREIRALGRQVDLLSANVSVISDVEKAFSQSTGSIGGII
jgi:NAD(P)-dependent dehydrogenase (short-subunit alcohol dehydrogenase family)